jgi:hypothetical protein
MTTSKKRSLSCWMLVLIAWSHHRDVQRNADVMNNFYGYGFLIEF